MTAVPAEQAPAWQVSLVVHASPSLQAAPFAFVGLEQVPFAASQVPTSWHWSCAVQITGLAPVQAPAWQVSLCVQASASLQAVPFAFGAVPQVPALQTASRHALPPLPQSAGPVQPTQRPAPSHLSAPPTPQAVSIAVLATIGAPATQVLSVQSLPSFTTSRSSGTASTAPLPSHWLLLQSPLVCDATGAPCIALTTPHTPMSQERVWHSVSCPGQSSAIRHSTQLPVPSQSEPVPLLQTSPDASGGFDGTPAVQTSSVQSLSSTGRSASSSIASSVPCPLHWNTLQSPAMLLPASVPAATGSVPHSPPTHVFVTHGLPGSGQSEGCWQGIPPVPPPPVTPPVPPVPPVTPPVPPVTPPVPPVPPPPVEVVSPPVPPDPILDRSGAVMSSHPKPLVKSAATNTPNAERVRRFMGAFWGGLKEEKADSRARNAQSPRGAETSIPPPKRRRERAKMSRERSV